MPFWLEILLYAAGILTSIIVFINQLFTMYENIKKYFFDTK